MKKLHIPQITMLLLYHNLILIIFSMPCLLTHLIITLFLMQIIRFFLYLVQTFF